MLKYIFRTIAHFGFVVAVSSFILVGVPNDSLAQKTKDASKLAW